MLSWGFSLNRRDRGQGTSQGVKGQAKGQEIRGFKIQRAKRKFRPLIFYQG